MGCNSQIQARKEENVQETKQNQTLKEKNMSSSMVLRKMPEFKVSAYDAKNDSFTEAKSDDYKENGR